METRVKYPRTYHLPWSETVAADDKVLSTVNHFDGKEVVVTEKMDGENTTLYRDAYHARSIDSGSHPSRAWVKAFHAGFAHEIPEGMRVCGENLYAKHTIKYENLPEYFLVFSIWNGNICLSWDETVEYAALLGLKTVPVLYRGIWNVETVKGLYRPIINGDPVEGYVVRVAGSFGYDAFSMNVAKFVKGTFSANIGVEHWQRQAVTVNNRI